MIICSILVLIMVKNDKTIIFIEQIFITNWTAQEKSALMDPIT